MVQVGYVGGEIEPSSSCIDPARQKFFSTALELSGVTTPILNQKPEENPIDEKCLGVCKKNVRKWFTFGVGG